MRKNTARIAIALLLAVMMVVSVVPFAGAANETMTLGKIPDYTYTGDIADPVLPSGVSLNAITNVNLGFDMSNVNGYGNVKTPKTTAPSGYTAVKTLKEFHEAALAKKNIILMANITLTGTYTNTAGTTGVKYAPVEGYTGTLDGNGYNFYTNVPLFKAPKNATFMNFIVEGKTSISVTTAIGKTENKNGLAVNSTEADYAAVVCGTADGCKFFNVANTAAVKSNGTTGTNKGRAAGIVGRTKGATVIVYCKNSGVINGTDYAAGIVELASQESGASIKIYNCENTGFITSTDVSASGIAAAIENESGSTTVDYVVNCYNNASVYAPGGFAAGIAANLTAGNPSYVRVSGCRNGQPIQGKNASGIVGYARWQLTVDNCLNQPEGTVTGVEAAGGIFASRGFSEAYYNTANKTNSLVISECENRAKITTSAGHAGGIAGFMGAGYVLVQYCKNTGNSNEYDVVATSGWAGGIIGHIDGLTGTTTEAYVVDCVSLSPVTSVINNATTDGARAGGIVGVIDTTHITFLRCQNMGDVKVTLAEGIETVEKDILAGGITARTNGGITAAYCRNDGDVTIDVAFPDALNGGNAGGIIGWSAGSDYPAENKYNGTDHIFTHCINTGDITSGTVSDDVEGADEGVRRESTATAGAIAGYLLLTGTHKAEITYCMNSGKISAWRQAAYGIGYTAATNVYFANNVFGGDLESRGFPNGFKRNAGTEYESVVSSRMLFVWVDRRPYDVNNLSNNFYSVDSGTEGVVAVQEYGRGVDTDTNGPAIKATNVPITVSTTVIPPVDTGSYGDKDPNDEILAQRYDQYFIEYYTAKFPEYESISTPEQLLNIKWYGKYQLTANIDFRGFPTIATRFDGILEGNGKTITVDNAVFDSFGNAAIVRNLVTAGTVSGRYLRAGLVYYAAGLIENVTNKANIDNLSGGDYVGGIAGKQLPGSLLVMRNCRNEGTIQQFGPGSHVGGIIGGTTGGTDGFYRIENCTNAGAVKHNGSSSSTAHGSAGGIMGSSQVADGTFIGCVNLGAITSTNYHGNNGAGGILGYCGNSFVTIKDCTNGKQGDATVGTVSGVRAAGILGNSAKGYQIDNCKNYANITALKLRSPVDQVWAGGILNKQADTGALLVTCTNSANYGAIKSEGNYAGGIAGKVDASSNVITFDNCHNSGNVTGIYDVGGILGYSDQTDDADHQFANAYTVIENCTNSGTVTSTSVIEGRAGGIVAHIYQQQDSSRIENCKNTGTIKGYRRAGGIVAFLASKHANEIKNCVNLGKIDVTNFVERDGAGGILGYNSDYWVSIENCVNGQPGDATVGTVTGVRAAGIIGNSAKGYKIDNCANYANITAKILGSTTAEDARAGGILNKQADTGALFTTCTNSSNSGTITSAGNYAGGIAGQVGSSGADVIFANCENTGTVTSIACMGGIAGRIDSTHINEVKGCVNLGAITSSTADATALVYDRAGGIVGESFYGISFSYCFNAGAVTTDATIQSGAAGILGYAQAKTGGEENYNFDHCTNTGAITSSGGYAGGMFGVKPDKNGATWSGVASDSYLINATNCRNTGNLTGGNAAAGMAAYMNQTAQITDTLRLHIFDNCINEGMITVTAVNKYAAGIVGYVWSSSGTTDTTGSPIGVKVTNCVSLGTIRATADGGKTLLTMATKLSALVGYANTSNTIYLSGNHVDATLQANGQKSIYYETGASTLEDVTGNIKDNYIYANTWTTATRDAYSAEKQTEAANGLRAKGYYNTAAEYTAAADTFLAKNNLTDTAVYVWDKSMGALATLTEGSTIKVGETEYATLYDATKAVAENGGTIVITGNYRIFDTEPLILAGGKVTLDATNATVNSLCYGRYVPGLQFRGNGEFAVERLVVFAKGGAVAVTNNEGEALNVTFNDCQFYGGNRLAEDIVTDAYTIGTYGVGGAKTGYGMEVAGLGTVNVTLKGESVVKNNGGNKLGLTVAAIRVADNANLTIENVTAASDEYYFLRLTKTDLDNIVFCPTVTVKGGNFTSREKTSYLAAIINLHYGTLNMEGGYYENNRGSIVRIYGNTKALAEDTARNLNISGGTYVLTAGDGFSDTSDYTNAVVRMDTQGHVKIAGGTFINQKNANSVAVIDTTTIEKYQDGSLTVTGGRFLAKASNGEMTYFVRNNIDSTKNITLQGDGKDYQVKYAGEAYNLLFFADNSSPDWALTMQYGAQVRIPQYADHDKTQAGIRFVTYIDLEKFNGAEGVEFGTLIAPMQYVAAASSFTHAGLNALSGTNVKYVDIKSTGWGQLPVDTDGDGVNDVMSLRAALINIKQSNYERPFAAIAYALVDGVYYYGTFNSIDNVRSMESVVEAAITDFETNPDTTLTGDDADLLKTFRTGEYWGTVTSREVTETLMSSAAREIFEDAPIHLLDKYQTGGAPYISQNFANLTDCTVKTLTMPIKETGTADADGNVKLTLYTVNAASTATLAVAETRSATHVIKVQKTVLDEAIAAGNYFYTFDLATQCNTGVITLGKNQTIAFFADITDDGDGVAVDAADTIFPGYLNMTKDSTAENFDYQTRFLSVYPEARGFYTYVGRGYGKVALDGQILLFDVEITKTYTSAEKTIAEEKTEYDSLMEAIKSAYAGKNVSILGDSISTFQGISNNTDYNETIGKNAIYYNDATKTAQSNTNTKLKSLASMDLTYWGRLIKEGNMNLCVSNAWSGSRVYGTAGSNYVDNAPTRAKQLHNKAGQNPDVILFFMGINDATASSPWGDLYNLLMGATNETRDAIIAAWFQQVLVNTEDGTNLVAGVTYTTFEQAYALTLYNMMTTYADADIFAMDLLYTYSRDTAKVAKFNYVIHALVEYFEKTYGADREGTLALVKQNSQSGINLDTMHGYMVDYATSNGKATTDANYVAYDTLETITKRFQCLHPNVKGHQLMTQCIAKVMKTVAESKNAQN